MQAIDTNYQRTLCLQLLRSAGHGGATLRELELGGVGVPSNRLSELRKAGHIIRGKRDGKGTTWFRYYYAEDLGEAKAAKARELAEALLRAAALDAKPPALLSDLDHAHGELRVLDGRLVLVPLGKGKPPVLVCSASAAGKMLSDVPRRWREAESSQCELFGSASC